ncbi:MAG: zinc metallopeptidase [Clostridia bacterium]|nr:zinc metallopeptidase [Clostridia bacterium]
MYYYFDSTMLLVLPGLLLAMWAQYRVKNAYREFSRVYSRSGLTGAEAARRILDAAGLSDIRINRVSGELSDNFDPTKNELNLSDGVYGSTSISAIGVAAHECGHAMQKSDGYAMLSMRSSIAPIVSIGSNLSWPIFLIGMIFSMRPLILAGIILFSLIVAFTLITLPVEFNASRRAVACIETGGYLADDEIRGAKKVLNAAALTYVASALNAILQLARLLLLSNRRGRD